MTPHFDFYHEYARLHRAVYGRDPCSRSEWDEWCKQKPNTKSQSDLEFDIETERREGWGYGE